MYQSSPIPQVMKRRNSRRLSSPLEQLDRSGGPLCINSGCLGALLHVLLGRGSLGEKGKGIDNLWGRGYSSTKGIPFPNNHQTGPGGGAIMH